MATSWIREKNPLRRTKPASEEFEKAEYSSPKGERRDSTSKTRKDRPKGAKPKSDPKEHARRKRTSPPRTESAEKTGGFRYTSKDKPDAIYELPSVFTDPQSRTLPVQHKALQSILQTIGISKMPSPLVTLTQNYDAFQALRLYIKRLNFTFDEVRKKTEKRDLLDEFFGKLASIDYDLLDSSELSDAALYEAMATHDVSHVNIISELMHKVAQLKLKIAKHSLPFQRFKDDFTNRSFDNWHEMSLDLMNELEEELPDWVEFGAYYTRLKDKIKALIYKMETESRFLSRDRDMFLATVLKIDQLIQCLETTRKCDDKESDILEELVVHFETLKTIDATARSSHREKDASTFDEEDFTHETDSEAFEDGESYEDDDPEETLDLDETVRSILTDLELTDYTFETATSEVLAELKPLLHKQRNILVKRYHPDFNPECTDCEEKIRRVNKAYSMWAHITSEGFDARI